MPLPEIQALVNVGNISANARLAFTTVGVATARVTFTNLAVQLPNVAYARASFGKLYSATKPPYSLATFFKISSVVHLVQTPGFQAAPLFNIITPSIQGALVSISPIAQGLITPYQFGLQTVIQGPPDGVQIPLNSLGLITNGIPASGTTTSPVIPSFYYPHIVCSAESTQAGAINIQRYIDAAGTIPNGAAITAALSANTLAVSDTVSALGFGSFTVQITNTGTLPAVLSNFALLLLAR